MTECSGGPGRLARRRTALEDAHRSPAPRRRRRRRAVQAGAVRHRRRPGPGGDRPLRRSPTAPSVPGCLRRGEEDRRPAVDERHHGAERPLGHRFGRVGVGGQVHPDRHRFGGRALHLPHHQLPAVGRGRPVHPPPAGPRAGRAARPGARRSARRRPARAVAGGRPRRRGNGSGRPRRGPTCSHGGERRARTRLASTTAGRRARRVATSTTTAVDARPR